VCAAVCACVSSECVYVRVCGSDYTIQNVSNHSTAH